MDRLRYERRQFFRGKARPGRVLPIRFKTTLHPAWMVAETRNIGVGGAYIATADVQEVGTSLTVELTLPTTDRVFVLPSIVRWASTANPAGMGVQFVGVDVDILLELTDYFSTLTV
jgi:Tfp pilus assembly protein PilZ